VQYQNSNHCLDSMYDRDYKNQLNWTLVPVGPGVAPLATPDAPAPVAPPAIPALEFPPAVPIPEGDVPVEF